MARQLPDCLHLPTCASELDYVIGLGSVKCVQNTVESQILLLEIYTISGADLGILKGGFFLENVLATPT